MLYGKDRGVLAVPHPKMYFLAFQLQQLTGWGQYSSMDPVAHLVSLSNPILSTSSHLEMDLLSIPPSSPMAVLLKRLRLVSKETFSITGRLEFAPLWHNSNYPKLHNICRGFTYGNRKGSVFVQKYSLVPPSRPLTTYVLNSHWPLNNFINTSNSDMHCRSKSKQLI